MPENDNPLTSPLSGPVIFQVPSMSGPIKVSLPALPTRLSMLLILPRSTVTPVVRAE